MSKELKALVGSMTHEMTTAGHGKSILGVDNVRKALRETLDVIVKIVCCLRIDGIAKNVLRMVAGDKLVLQELVILVHDSNMSNTKRKLPEVPSIQRSKSYGLAAQVQFTVTEGGAIRCYRFRVGLVIKKNPTAVYAGSFRFSLEYEILAVVRRFRF